MTLPCSILETQRQFCEHERISELLDVRFKIHTQDVIDHIEGVSNSSKVATRARKTPSASLVIEVSAIDDECLPGDVKSKQSLAQRTGESSVDPKTHVNRWLQNIRTPTSPESGVGKIISLAGLSLGCPSLSHGITCMSFFRPESLLHTPGANRRGRPSRFSN